jgi:hypothetical protein
MDPEIQKGIEDHLHRQNRGARPSRMRSLLGAAPEAQNEAFDLRLSQADAATQQEVAAFRETAAMLHQLQVPADVEDLQPSPGYYARLMERIEAERNSNSFWSIFLNPQFSRRLLFASATLLVLLAVTFATVEGDTGWFGTAAPELVENAFAVPEDFAVASAAEPIESGLARHTESDGHDQIFVELATFSQSAE